MKPPPPVPPPCVEALCEVVIEHIHFLLVHSGYNIVVGEIWNGLPLLLEVLHCLPELLVIVRIEDLKKVLLTIT